MNTVRDSRRTVFLSLWAALALLACGGAKPSPAPPSDAGLPVTADAGSKPDGGTSSSPDAGPKIVVCPPATTYGGGGQPLVPGAVTATLVDETGAPVAAGQPISLCGINICAAPSMVGAGGAASIMTNDLEQKPAFKFGDGVDYAEFAIPLTASPSDFRTMGTGLLATARFAGKPGVALMPGADATSGDVILSLAAGASVGINPLIYFTPDTALFRAVNVPLTNAGPLLPATPGDFALLFGMAPAETTICPPAKMTVRVPASLGWAPGAAVEFWIMTTDTGQTYAPYGGWALMSDGAVSADGQTVVTADGQGFRLLENFAIRLKP